MNFIFASLLSAAILSPTAVFAQSEVLTAASQPKPPTPEDISTLPKGEMAAQEYMARRAQRIREREASLIEAQSARDDIQRKSVLDKLASDERAFRASTANLTRQMQDSQKAKVSSQRPNEKK